MRTHETGADKAAAQRSAPQHAPAGAAGLLALQQSAGNRAVSSTVDEIVQRVAVTQTGTTETLYNQGGGGSGQFTSAPYGGNSVTYDMTRSGDTGVTVTVRIKYLSQARNTTPPPPGAPPGTPQLGQLIGSPTEIPANDARRAWATGTAAAAVAHWNNRLTFVGVEHNLLRPDTHKRLPVTFRSVAVFGLNEPAHRTVIVHPPAIVPGTPGQPIDAGNYYMQDPAHRSAAYPASDDVIYAHEYGHLIGIPDEYSQSNEMLNTLLHQAAPGSAPSARAALDRASVERMALAALSRPLYAQLSAAMPAVTAQVSRQRSLVARRMAAAARAGATAAGVRAQLQSQLTAASEASLGPAIAGAVAFETTRNFSSVSVARQGVAAGFAPAALVPLIQDAYWHALLAPHDTNVAVAGFDDVRIDVSGAVYATTGAGGPQAAAGAGYAATAVGPAAPGGPGLPPLPAPTMLSGQLAALPGTWAAAGSALEAAVTPAAFGTAMTSALRSAAAAAAAALPPGATPPAKLARAGALYRRAYTLVNNAAVEASRQIASDLVLNAMRPVLTASVTSLQAAISTEVTRIMTTPPSGVARAGPADANMAAIVAAMKARLDADKAATAGTGRDPLHPSGGGAASAPGQDVTYSAQGLMGASHSTAVRADQFAPMVGQFNANLKTFWERRFTAEVR